MLLSGIIMLCAAQPAVAAAQTADAATRGFEEQRGSMARPVRGSYKVTEAYGPVAIEGSPKVKVSNPGIDIKAGRGSKARAVYEGTVAGVYRAPGLGWVVILRHGDYRTVYANLHNVVVRKGAKVKTGDILGTVETGVKGRQPTLHFEIWKNRTRLNPSEWIK